MLTHTCITVSGLVFFRYIVSVLSIAQFCFFLFFVFFREASGRRQHQSRRSNNSVVFYLFLASSSHFTCAHSERFVDRLIHACLLTIISLACCTETYCCRPNIESSSCKTSNNEIPLLAFPPQSVKNHLYDSEAL